jgi:hypothetical protein
LTGTAKISKIGVNGKTIMHRPSIPRHIIGLAVAVAVIIPIAICLVLGVAALLSAMGDASGGGVLRWIVLGFGILWALDLVLLILGLSVNVLSDSDDSDSHEQ